MRIACLGGAHHDIKAHLHAPARPGSSNPARFSRSPGGVACNVARNLARLGVGTTLCSVVGTDPAAEALLARVATEGVETAGVSRDAEHPTASYLAILDPDGSLVLGVADTAVYDALHPTWADRAAERVASADLWVVDANLPGPVLTRLLEIAPVPVFADPVSAAKAGRLRPVLERFTAVFPDRAEAAMLAGGEAGDPAGSAEAIVAAGTDTVVVTLGGEGAHLRDAAGAITRPPIRSTRVVDVTGAGDALLAGFAFAFLSGEADPLGWGLAAASLTVESEESVAPGLSVAAIRERLSA